MASLHDGQANGVNGHSSKSGSIRYSDVPKAVSVAVAEMDGPIDVEISLDDDIQDDPTELCTLLENEDVPKSMWMTVALGYARQKKTDVAIEVLTRSLSALSRGRPDDRLSLLNALCWLNLLKCREAPRIRPEGQLASETRTKEDYIQAATTVLNDASRISPSYPPLFLARGVLQLLRVSLQPPSKPGAGSQNSTERLDTLRQALKCFDDALRASDGKNLMALMGKARVQYSLGNYADALQAYQSVLQRNSELIDPDPRIGIGCCFWQLGHKDDALAAWTRAHHLNPNSKIAKILLGLYYLHQSSQYAPSDPEFKQNWNKAMAGYVQNAFKLDDKLPLTCATFAGYFLFTKAMPNVEKLSRRAIDLTDVNAVASDGWYLLARKEHTAGEISKASEYYLKADQARGGDERGYIPAKFGAAQIKVLIQDFDGAKFRLEKLIQQTKSIEAQTLLGTLYAEDVFLAQSTNSKEDKSNELKKAISNLEAVRASWKDSKRKVAPDSAVLLNLARLYEGDQPEKSLQCLQQVEKMELDAIPEDEKPTDIEDEAAVLAALREFLPPQLLNNMGCFRYQSEKYAQARELFQTALNACVKIGEKDDSVDTDALVTTISYNLARTYEAEGMPDEAKRVYEGLLARHSDYIDAIIRLTYISLRQNPADDGPKAMQKLYQSDSSNLEVRALYGWYLSKAKRRTANIAEDNEFRHYKHTLQQYDKHDRYTLTGMGNIHLIIAREMRKDSEEDRQKRSAMYRKSIEFFDKALSLDPRNVYAAQGIAIALIEDKKDLASAIQIFNKVKDSMKDASVYINLGHAYCELKQYSRAIENYEAALAKDRARDPQILACLGRTWLLRGKQERSIRAMRTSLEYSIKALEVAPEQIHFKFNVAFVQIQIAQLIHTLDEKDRTLEEVQVAATGLDEAIESFSAIAKSPNPPFPKNDIEQRVNMGRNTMRRQLEGAIQKQKEYEEKHQARLQQAREVRDAEIKRREDDRKKMEEAAAEQKRKIAEERARMEELDRETIEKRRQEERRRQEFIADDEERRKEGRKGKGKRKKKGDDLDTDDEDDVGGGRSARNGADSGASSAENDRKRGKKRKLERKSKISNKFKSSELVDSDSEGDTAVAADDDIDMVDGDEGDNNESVSRPRKPNRIIDDEDDDEHEANEGAETVEQDSDA